MMDWKRIARRDAELRAAEANASEALAKLRWENTLGATPPTSFAEYARQCGVALNSVRTYARAHEVCSSASEPVSVSDALVRAGTSADRADVIETIAEQRGVSMKAVQAHHGDEVRRVESIARERATARGTSIREEAAKVAEVAERQRRSEHARQADRSRRLDMRYLELERHLHRARRSLIEAVSVEVVDLDDEHRELLADAIRSVRDLLGLVEAKFTGAAQVDWDAELERLTS